MRTFSTFATLLCFSLSVSVAFLPSCVRAATQNEYMQSTTTSNPRLHLPKSVARNKTAYVHVTNTTGVAIDLASQVETALKQRGYAITNTADTAMQVVDINIVQAGKNSMDDVHQALKAGYAGLAAAPTASNPNLQPGGQNLGVAVSNANILNLTYSVIADVHFAIKARTSTMGVQQPQQVTGASGTSANTLSHTNITNIAWDNYKTRMVSYAIRVHMPFDKAAPILSENIAKKTAQLLPK